MVNIFLITDYVAATQFLKMYPITVCHLARNFMPKVLTQEICAFVFLCAPSMLSSKLAVISWKKLTSGISENQSEFSYNRVKFHYTHPSII